MFKVLEEDFYLLALKLSLKLSPSNIIKLSSEVGSYKKLFNISFSELKKLGITETVILKFIKDRSLKETEKEIETAKKDNVDLIFYNSEYYPDKIKEIFEPPLVIYSKGNKELLSSTSVGIVGARRCCSYSRKCAEEIAETISRNNITVISGMALGIDACAHRSTVSNNGNTVAVLACDVRRAYPLTNRKLYQKIVETGCVISEYKFGTPPRSYNFPVRNRIIAALSDDILIIEAGIRSGTMITAGFAAEFSKNLWVIPGNITDKGFEGSNILIQQGAMLCTSAWDILEDFNIKRGQQTFENNISLNNNEKKIIALLKKQPITLEDILNTTKNKEVFYSVILRLEMKNIIYKKNGIYYLKKSL